MTAMGLVGWLATCAVAWGVLQVANVLVTRRRNAAVRVIWAVAKLLLIPVIALGTMAFNHWVWWRFASPFVALYAALLADIPVSVGVAISRHVSDTRRRPKHTAADQARTPNGKVAVLASLVLTCAVVACGTANSQLLTCEHHRYSSAKLEQGYTFAFIADVHYGTAQRPEVLERLVDEVNAADVDFVVLGGDITDEHSTAQDMQAAYQVLAGLDAPTYYVYGNHDRQPDAAFVGGRSYTDEELATAIAYAGITILSDEAVALGPDLVLLGREDISAEDGRTPYDQLPPVDDGTFLLVADHQPYDEAEIEAAVGDLQVSGHTHAGQLFPNRMIYGTLGLPAYGEYDCGSLQLLVSAGESGWFFPFRTEAHCTFDIVELVPAA